MKLPFHMSFPVILLFCLLILSSIATISLWHPGFPLTHDGDVHLMRITSFYESLSQGIVIPRWAANINWGYGQPVFEFFYPLPSYLASFLHIFHISFADSIKILLGASLILSGVTMYLWLSCLTNPIAACTGAFLYMFAPYRFVDIYVRGDVGESFALIFIPLICYFLLKTAKKEGKYAYLWASFFLGILILSHNIVSLMALPFILFYSFCLFSFSAVNKKHFFIQGILIFVLGFSLSAFFWVPGLFEGKYTLRDIVTKGGYLTNFTSLQALFYGKWSYGISGQFTTQIGIFQWVSFLLGICSLPFFWKKQNFLLITGLVIYCLIAIFLMLPLSNMIWSKIILLQNFQFPWRFLIVTTFTTSLIAAIILDKIPKKVSLSIFAVLVITTIVVEHSYWQPKAYVNRPDSYFAGIVNAPSDTGESSPIWSVRFMEHGFINPLQVISGSAKIIVGQRTFTKHLYTVQALTRAQLLENTLYFPGWHILIDGKETNVQFQNENYRGLMLFTIPSGAHAVVVQFSETKFRIFADMISLVGVVVLLSLFILESLKKYSL